MPAWEMIASTSWQEGRQETSALSLCGLGACVEELEFQYPELTFIDDRSEEAFPLSFTFIKKN